MLANGPLITSRVGTWLDSAVFARLNAACAAEPEPEPKSKPAPKQKNRTCEHCERPALARGMCKRHYDRWRTHGDPLKGRNEQPATCTQCDKPSHAFGLCNSHYWLQYHAKQDPAVLKQRTREKYLRRRSDPVKLEAYREYQRQHYRKVTACR